MTSKYKQALTDAMRTLGADPRTVFVGQSLIYGGTGMSETFSGVPRDKLIEFPVAEEFQMGLCNGLALAGKIPICVFPRWNFALLAADQLVNHLDKMGMKVIIRVGVGSTKPLDPGPQHVGDYSKQFMEMCPNMNFAPLLYAEGIADLYAAALSSPRSTVLTEYMSLYEA